MKYLLDTNILIELLPGNSDIAKRIIKEGNGNCFMSVITLYELCYGAFHSNNPEHEMQKVNLLADIRKGNKDMVITLDDLYRF